MQVLTTAPSLSLIRYERYLGHVKRLEEEVIAAKAHAANAEQDLQSAKRESAAQVLASDGL
jgi:predicted secreted Zn-dependent protease